MSLSTECAAALLSFRYPSYFCKWQKADEKKGREDEQTLEELN